MRDFEKFTVGRFRTSRQRRSKAPSLAAVGIFFCVGLALVTLSSFGVLSGSGGQDSPIFQSGSELLGNREFGDVGGSTQAEDTGSSTQTSRDSGDAEPVNVLLLGLDGREDASEGEVQRSDTLMLARTYPDTGEIKLLSIPRDLIVEGVGPVGQVNRINSAYAYGGADATVDAVENLTRLPVDHHVSADFEGFEEIVDTMGGVEVEVKEDYLAHRGIPSGKQTLNGKEALLYARYRKTPKGDLGRIQRQQQILAAFRSQAFSWDSISGSLDIIRSLDDHVETDVGVPRMVSLGSALAGNDKDGELETYQLEGIPSTLSDGRQVLLPNEQRNKEILQEFAN